MSAKPAALESIEVGDIQITYLPDGDASVSAAALFPTGTPELWDTHRELFDADGKLLLTLGSFLIRTAGRNVLVDLGFGPHSVEFPAADGVFRSGGLLTSLDRAGLRADDVDVVFYTHLHIDHTGWTVSDSGATFAKAQHMTGVGELSYWRDLEDPALAAVGPGAALPALLERAEEVADGSTLAPGVTVVATPGHTPGHCSLVISSGPDRAVLLGDVLHCPAQLTDNDVSMVFDVDPDLARRTRDRIAAEYENDQQTVMAQGHFTESVFGRIMVGTASRTWSSAAPQPRS